MSMLWITSFNQEIYDASAVKLWDSKRDTNTEGTFYFGIEDGLEGFTDYDENLEECDLDRSTFLQAWLLKNQDICPPKPCKCPNPWERSERKHKKPNCPHTWFNRNAYRWFKKIATLYEAYQFARENDYRYLLWIDADCVFKQNFTEAFLVEELLLNNFFNMLYLKGSERKVIEAGFVCYDVGNVACKDLLNEIFEVYNNGFRNFKRWDDSYVIQKMIQRVIRSKDLIPRDLATTINDKWSGVFENSMIGDHITHNKGKHGRKLGIMK